MRRVALVAGVNRYNDPEITTLEFAEVDAAEVHAFLKDRAAFDTVEYLTGHQVTPARVRDAIKALVGSLDPGDLFVFYFSGHGIELLNQHLLLGPDAQRDCLEYADGAIQVNLLKKLTSRPGVHRVFILDACRKDVFKDKSGLAVRGAVEPINSTRALRDLARSSGATPNGGEMAILCSCAEGRVAVEPKPLKHGVFTLALLQAMKARLDRRVAITVGEDLMSAVRAGMERLLAKAGEEAGQAPWIATTGALPPLVACGQAEADRPVDAVVTATAEAAPPPLVTCTLCGAHVPLVGTFQCKACGRDHLCKEHMDRRSLRCLECTAAPPVQPPAQPVICPTCGEYNPVGETFVCRVCGQAHLCRRHRNPVRDCCMPCAERAPVTITDPAPDAIQPPHPGQLRTVDLGAGRVLELVWVPATTSPEWARLAGGREVFAMGSPESEEGVYKDEQPMHDVRLTRGFWLGRYPVTQRQWQHLMGENPAEFVGAGPDAPVESVSWDDCTAFLARLNERAPTGGFRLPTEAEWEYACRAGTRTASYAGPVRILGLNNAPALDAIAWYGGNSGVDQSWGYDTQAWQQKQYPHTKAGAHPVGKKKPNAWGLYDTLGNVSEWCATVYSAYAPGAETDPVGPRRGDFHAIRGGNWQADARDCRAGYRVGLRNSVRSFFTGCRVACDEAGAHAG